MERTREWGENYLKKSRGHHNMKKCVNSHHVAFAHTNGERCATNSILAIRPTLQKSPGSQYRRLYRNESHTVSRVCSPGVRLVSGL